MGSLLKRILSSGTFLSSLRGNNKRDIFHDTKDRFHFIALLKEFRFKCTLTFSVYGLSIKTHPIKYHKSLHCVNSSNANFFIGNHHRTQHLSHSQCTNYIIKDKGYLPNLSFYVYLFLKDTRKRILFSLSSFIKINWQNFIN